MAEHYTDPSSTGNPARDLVLERELDLEPERCGGAGPKASCCGSGSPPSRTRPWRPRSTGSDFPSTAVITMEPSATGTSSRAVAVHGTTELASRHEEMGFHDGWGAALDQLVELAREL